MVNLLTPVETEMVIWAIAFVFLLVGIGLLVVKYYEKRYHQQRDKEQK